MKICDLFYSIQGEGFHVGRAGIFIRYFGCDLSCDFCDEPLHKQSYTDFTEEELLSKIKGFPSKFIILTGGEPSIYELSSFITKLQSRSYSVAVETNGFHPGNIKLANWITYSPKNWDSINFDPFFDEIKLIVNHQSNTDKILTVSSKIDKPLYIQPEATQKKVLHINIEHCVNLVKAFPNLRLSLQTQKLIHIP